MLANKLLDASTKARWSSDKSIYCAGATDSKYGDADVSSKRRKSLSSLDDESMDETSVFMKPEAKAESQEETAKAEEEHQYRQFEAISQENDCNSSFHYVNDDEDFKGGLLASNKAEESRDPPQKQQTSAKISSNSLTITENPSLASQGFANTLKLLEHHVNLPTKRTHSVLGGKSLSAFTIPSVSSSPSSTSLSSFSSSSSSALMKSSILEEAEEEEEEGDEPPTRLELELEASKRIATARSGDNINCDNASSTTSSSASCYPSSSSSSSSASLSGPVKLIGFLTGFLAKTRTSHIAAQPQPELGQPEQTTDWAKSEPPSPNLIYHAHRGGDGQKCIRVVHQNPLITTAGNNNISSDKVLCGNRVSQMTRAYDDIEAVTRLLEEKEKDLELTVQIGKELLTQNNGLEARIIELEADLKNANDDRAQLVHELHKKNELIAVLTNDDGDTMDETPTYSKSITVDLLQKKITSLLDENKVLKQEASQLACETDEVEAQERALMQDISSQLNEANSQFDHLSLELERQREENRLQHEQIVSLTARLAEAEMRLHQLTADNDEHLSLLTITKENQNSLALELVEFKQRYQEVLALLQETQEQLRKQRKKTQPQARSSFMGSSMMMSQLAPDSLQSELMESSLYSENSLDSGISGDNQRINDRLGRLMSQVPGVYGGVGGPTGAAGMAYATSGGAVPPYKRVFETVRCAAKNGTFGDSGNVSMSQLGAMSMSSSSGVRMSAMAGSNSHPAGSFHRNSSGSSAGFYGGDGLGLRTLSCESLASQSDDGYPTQPTGVPGAPGAKDLEAALKRLTPAEVLARRAMLSYGPAGSYNYDDPPMQGGSGATAGANQPMGIRTPDSIMSTGSSGISSSTHMSSSSVVHQWRLPEKLQIVKPIEGSQTLHHWSRLATPTFGGLLEERPGVTIRGGRGLDDLGLQVYTLSDVEEDVSDDLPGKQFEASGCTYTFTTSMVMHPDDGIVNDLSFLSQSQVSSRMASTSTSRQPSCPPTPRGLSRKNSCSTFSVDLSLASMLNERGIKAVTPSALNTPAGPNFSPTVTPCNSPEGSPTRSMSPEPLFGILSSGADLIRRKLVGGDMERPNRNLKQQQKQKILLTRLERRALRSLKLVEKVESLGLENIIASHPSAVSQLGSGIASRSSSPMAQLTSLKNIHTASNSVVDDLHFDRQQIKEVLHKGLHTPTRPSSSSAAAAAAEEKKQEKVLGPSPSGSSSAASSQIRGAPAPAAAATPATASMTDTRLKQMQRQKSRRNLKNGMAQQRPDLGTTGGSGGGRVRPDLGRVSANDSGGSKHKAATAADSSQQEPQSIAQSFVGSVSSLLFGRKGGWL